VDDHPGAPTSTYCRSCGRGPEPQPQNSEGNRSRVYQVVIACAICGSVFAAFSRN
jgi:hypothetical protein